MKKFRVALSGILAVMVLVSSVYVFSAEDEAAADTNAEVTEVESNENNDSGISEGEQESQEVNENISEEEPEEDISQVEDIEDENNEETEKTQKEIVEEKVLELGYIDGVGYTYFEPENGFVGKPIFYGHGDNMRVRAQVEECTLIEKITFTGEYEENECEIECLGIAEEGDKLTCTMEHYFTSENEIDLYVLHISGSKGTLSRYYEWYPGQNRLTVNSDLKQTTYNGLKFVYNVEAGMGYREYDSNTGDYVSTINIRGGVKNDEIIELWTEFTCAEKNKTNAGLMRCTDIKHEVFDEYDIYDDEESFLAIFSIEYNSTLDAIPGIPAEYQRKTKEEQIEEHGNYYDEEGEFHGALMFNGTRNGLTYSDARIVNQVEFTLNKDFNEISSAGKTNFTLYEIITIMSDGEGYSREVSDTLMKLEGNLGKKIYILGSRTWRIPEGTKVVGREFLDGNSSYYTWSEVGEITEEYIDIIGGRGTEAASMTFHFSDDKRTGLDDIDFDFNGTKCSVKYDNLDYKGPFLSYFLYDLENWPEMAKSFGLTPVKKGE